jgi:hypothetical protein
VKIYLVLKHLNSSRDGVHLGPEKDTCRHDILSNCVGNLSPAMGARNQVGIGLSYRPASLCSLATQFQTRFLESIPRLIAGLKFSTQDQLIPVSSLDPLLISIDSTFNSKIIIEEKTSTKHSFRFLMHGFYPHQNHEM